MQLRTPAAVYVISWSAEGHSGVHFLAVLLAVVYLYLSFTACKFYGVNPLTETDLAYEPLFHPVMSLSSTRMCSLHLAEPLTSGT